METQPSVLGDGNRYPTETMKTYWPFFVGIGALIAGSWYLAQPEAEPEYVFEPNSAADYAAMTGSPHAVVQALNSGTLQQGSSEDELLAIQQPLWQKHYGRYRIFGYEPENSYNSTVVCTLDGNVISAGTGSCTWHWLFFDSLPEDVSRARYALDTYREIVADDPDMKGPLQTSFDAVYATLGMDENADDHAMHTEHGLRGFTNRSPTLRAR